MLGGGGVSGYYSNFNWGDYFGYGRGNLVLRENIRDKDK
ncbi:MAG: hypothetical protein BMS9Abin34_214 [Patescibacteria group bacterium]|nr:MAG: hypothetical protein BMS9Abin34_214 [Patescibacteria group bacterium]